jgi:NDP-sugar pyrophosphorylase family protein
MGQDGSSAAVAFAKVPVALLAGGLATRLRPITHKVPKCLVEVAGRPFIDHQLAMLRDNGIRRVVLCLGHLGALVTSHVGDGSRFGIDVSYSFDGDRLLGTGGALRRALPLLGDVFWVLYGDSYLDIDYRAIFNHFSSGHALGLMTVLHNGNQWDKSNALFDNGRLVAYDKRRPTPAMRFIDYGVALLRRVAVERIYKDEICDLADLYHDLVAAKEMVGYEVTRRFYEIGSPAGLEETQNYLARRVQ